MMSTRPMTDADIHSAPVIICTCVDSTCDLKSSKEFVWTKGKNDGYFMAWMALHRDKKITAVVPI
jgi:hypothetical protein